MASPDQIINVGIIGCGEEIAQTVHIPNLARMSRWFRITYLCDESAAALSHYSASLEGSVKTTHDPEELCASSDVQAVIITSPDVYHASHAILALTHDKSVFIEKPVALTKQDAAALEAAESKSKGMVTISYTTLFVAPLEDAVREMGGQSKILYARLRDPIISVLPGPFNKSFQQFSDVSKSYIEDTERIDWEMTQRALIVEDKAKMVTFASARIWRALSGSHSYHLSAMRSVLGMPIKVADTYSGISSWIALFQYPTFALSYESGTDVIPDADADLELHGDQKIIRLRYDRSTEGVMSVRLDVTEHKDGVDVESAIEKSYDDPYVAELKKLWAAATGSPSQSVIAEAMGDLDVNSMVMNQFHSAKV